MKILDKVIDQFIKDVDMEEQYYSQSGENLFSAFFKTGAHGEFATYKMLSKINGTNKCVANCYIPKEDGTTTEIDLLMIHETGIYVFESKNYSGYIFGSQNQKNWTQTLPAGRGKTEKNHFYNPIWQNQAHIRELKRLFEDIPMYSYIVFSERCSLKDVKADESIRIIKRNDLLDVLQEDIKNRTPVLKSDEINALFEKLDNLSHTSKKDKKEHIEQVSNIQKETENTDICPRCGSKLVLRTVKNGENAGKQFYGCSAFPKCRYTRNIESTSPKEE